MSVEERHLLNKKGLSSAGKHRKGIDCNAYSITETTV